MYFKGFLTLFFVLFQPFNSSWHCLNAEFALVQPILCWLSEVLRCLNSPVNWHTPPLLMSLTDWFLGYFVKMDWTLKREQQYDVTIIVINVATVTAALWQTWKSKHKSPSYLEQPFDHILLIKRVLQRPCCTSVVSNKDSVVWKEGSDMFLVILFMACSTYYQLYWK